MYGSTVLNVKLSIAILSGIGFIGVLTLAPLKPPKYKEKYIQEQDDVIPMKTIEKRQMALYESKKKEEKILFSIPAKKKFQQDFPHSIWGSEFISHAKDELLPLFSNQNNLKSNDSFRPDIFTYYKDEKLVVNSIGDTRSITNQILEYKYQNKLADNTGFSKDMNPQFKNVEMSYQINSNFSASFKSSQFDIFDDRLKQYPTTMAGVSFTGSKYISTGFIAGESTLNNPYRYNQGGFLNGNNFYRDTEVSYRDVDRVNKNLFEWQANVSPSKNIMFQTAVYNSNRSLINETNVSEGARVAMAVGLKYIVLNIKYNYLSDNLMRTIFRPEAASVFNKDYAAFGFTFFLDRYNRYSIYLGHNYYNIATQSRPSDSVVSVPTNNSFSASFRGRNNDYYNSTFFLNFKNNANRDYYYSSFGVFRLPIASQLIFEYATSLGLELSF